VQDWDRIRVFHGVAEAGSFTRAINLSQSAISRQIGALEEDVGTPLFHRHARGLILTEQGELLLESARTIASKIATTSSLLSESKEEPSGHLRVTANQGFGSFWLTSHLKEFLDLYPEITINLLVLDAELDLGMREADVAIRLTPPSKPDLIQKKLRTAHTHLYASPDYLEMALPLETIDDLDRHRLIDYGTGTTPPPVPSLNWVLEAGRDKDDPRSSREPALSINNVYGMLRAVQKGAGVASLPDYLGTISNRLVRVLPQLEGPSFDVYFVYPEEMRASARIGVFRDFLLKKMGEQQVW